MKVILSRKGFDSVAGGNYSPVDPQTGHYIVLPIPADDKEQQIANCLTYKDIRLLENYLPGYHETNL